MVPLFRTLVDHTKIFHTPKIPHDWKFSMKVPRTRPFPENHYTIHVYVKECNGSFGANNNLAYGTHLGLPTINPGPLHALQFMI